VGRRLVAAAFGDLEHAEAALAAAERLDPLDAAIALRGGDGRIELRQTRETSVGEGAVTGGTLGLLAGLLLGVPVLAAAAGLVGGAGFGARDTGISDDQLRALARRVEADQAVVCVLVDEERAAEAAAALAPFGGSPLP
jgi:uncharacterized membrane protein